MPEQATTKLVPVFPEADDESAVPEEATAKFVPVFPEADDENGNGLASFLNTNTLHNNFSLSSSFLFSYILKSLPEDVYMYHRLERCNQTSLRQV